MTLFGRLSNEVINITHDTGDPDRLVTRGKGQRAASEFEALYDSGKSVQLADQFVVFELSRDDDGPTILGGSHLTPMIEGSPDQPDVLAVMEMLSFHVGQSDHIEGDTSATLRVNFGKDESSTNKTIDTVFWALAAGLRLYDQTDDKRSATTDLNADFHKAFAKRPIEVPGGLGSLSFEVVKHREPKWWRKLLGLSQSDVAKQLVSVLGFPAS